MNPLSPFTYYRRHKRSALLWVGLVGLATFGVCVMVRLLDSVAEHADTTQGYLTRFSVVSAIGASLEPGVVSQVRAQPGVARAIPDKELYINLPPLQSGFSVFGVPEADMQVLMQVCGLRLKEGRLPSPRMNEIVLSEKLARALGLELGDAIGHSINEDYYRNIPTELVLVGILEGDGSTKPDPGIRLGLVSYEYLDSRELYASSPSGLIVVALEGHKAAVDDFLETTTSSPGAEVWTHRRMTELTAQLTRIFHLIFGIVDCLVAVVIALIVVTINQIALTQRKVDFGLLHAVGHGRRWLVRQLTLETAVVAGVGWVGGLALSWLLFAWLKVNVYEPSMELDLANWTPIWFAAPIPLAVTTFAAFSTLRTFGQFDAVTIIERDRLGTEASKGQGTASTSSSRPLSSWTYYLRHRRRGLALAVTMALMILGVAFPAFLFAPMVNANQLFIEGLRYVSAISPHAGTSVDPAVMAQVRTHPAVARVIPTIELRLLVEVPSVNRTTVTLYGVSEADMQILIDVFGVQLEEGRLPRPHSSEIVLSRAIATNRGLRVGDKVGRPVYEDDSGIPTEMEVVGIFGRSSQDLQRDKTADLWSGFASFEYLHSHELYSSYPVSLLIIPTEGRKGELDGWLQGNVASAQTAVGTYDTLLSEHCQSMWTLLLAFAAVESIVALVAAVALAVLSYTFFAERREEFGTLHAMGHSRSWLVRRTVGEAASAVAVAWLMGAAACAIGLIFVQADVYAPRGLTVDFLSPGPWLFTLPMPLAVVAVSTGLVVWMLSRLDPVSIIERRA
jgi:ABC-type lipoprotein release transport system permease subunit